MFGCLDSLIFPFTASIYYAVIDQDDYGIETETWIYDRDVKFMAQSVGDNSYRQDLNTGMFVKFDEGLTGRIPEDIRISSSGIPFAQNEILIAAITDEYGQCQYLEYGGPREGKSTAFEVKTIAPSFDPFGHRDYYKVILGRMQDQTAPGVMG